MLCWHSLYPLTELDLPTTTNMNCLPCTGVIISTKLIEMQEKGPVRWRKLRAGAIIPRRLLHFKHVTQWLGTASTFCCSFGAQTFSWALYLLIHDSALKLHESSAATNQSPLSLHGSPTSFSSLNDSLCIQSFLLQHLQVLQSYLNFGSNLVNFGSGLDLADDITVHTQLPFHHYPFLPLQTLVEGLLLLMAGSIDEKYQRNSTHVWA